MAGANFDVSGLVDEIDRIQNDLGGGAVEYRIVTNVEYGIYQEYGTSEMPAQPFMRPAAHEVQSQVAGIVKRSSSIDDAIRTVALKCLRKAKEYCPVDTGYLRASIRIERRTGGSWGDMGSFDGEIDLGTGETSGEVSA